jgi:uncharacterized protein YkvS
MRKAFLTSLVITLLIANCKNDNNPVTPATTDSPKFNPPVWIIGTWKDNYDITKYEFSANNVIMVSLQAGVSVDFKNGFTGATVTEDVNNNSEYKVSAIYPNMKQTFRFVIISDTTLGYYLIMSDDAHPEDTLNQSPILLNKE